MAKYLKIKTISGSDLYVYDQRYQFNSPEYLSLLELDPESNLNSIKMNGSDTSLFIKDVNFGINVSSTFIRVKFSEQCFNREFSLFGYGSQDDYLNHKSWGLIVKKDLNDNIKKFHLVISNETVTLEIPFINAHFSELKYNKTDWYSIILVQNNSEAKLFINSQMVDVIQLPIVLRRTTPIGKFYYGSLGETTYFEKFSGNVLNIGLWRREIDLYDIEDLSSNVDIGTHPDITQSSKKIKISNGKIYFDGFIHNVPEKTVYITGTGEESIYLVISSNIVTADDDSILNDTAIEYYNYGKPGADRLRYSYDILLNPTVDELKDKISLLLLKYKDGIIIENNLDKDISDTNNITNPNIVDDNITSDPTYKLILNKIAETVFDIHGNFIVSGLIPSISVVGDEILIKISPGVYYLNGRKYRLVNNIIKNIPKSSSTGNVFNETIYARRDPVALNRQPVTKVENIVGQTVNTAILIKGAPNGRDKIKHPNIRRLIRVYDSTGRDYSIGENGNDRNKSCWLDGDFINWNLDGPEPNSTTGGSIGQAYTVEYVRDSMLLEGIDYKLIKGNRYVYNEETVIIGFDIPIKLNNKPTKILSIKKGTSILDSDCYSLINGELIFPFDKKPVTLDVNDSITVEYSYSDIPGVAPRDHIIFFFNKGLIEDSAGQVNYKYLLNDIFTIIINNNNDFEVLKGIPGIGDNYQKPNIPDNCIPIADITAKPDDILKSEISYYNFHRMLASEIRTLVKRISTIEEKILLMELEKIAEKKSQDPNLLKGMFVDSLSSYNKSNYYHPDYTANINIYDKRLTSGIKLDEEFDLEPTNRAGNIQIRNERVSFKYINSSSEYSQLAYNSSIKINKFINSVVSPSIYISNDYLLISEKDNKVNNFIISNILNNNRGILPNNSEVDIYQNSAPEGSSNSYSNMSIVNMRMIMDNYKKMLSDFNMIFPDAKDRKFVVEGESFNYSEEGISLQFGDIKNYGNFEIVTNILEDDNRGLYYFIYGGKKYYLTKKYTDFSWKKIGNKIKCNLEGKFVIIVTPPQNVVCNNYIISVHRENGKIFSSNVNFNGLIGGLNDIITDGKRNTSGYYCTPKYPIKNIPGLVQSFVFDKPKTIYSVDLYFKSYNENDDRVALEIVELNDNNTVKSVLVDSNLTDDTIYKVESASDGYKVTIPLRNPVTLQGNKNYGIAISSNSINSEIQTYEFGKPSKLDNKIYNISNNLFGVIGYFNNNITLSPIETGVLRFGINSIDISNYNIDTENYYYQDVMFGEVSSTNKFNKFIILNEIDIKDTLNTKVDYKCSYDNGITWNNIKPYSIINLRDSVNKVLLKATIKSRDKNVAPSMFYKIKAIIPRYMKNSSYVSRFFGVTNDFEDYIAKIFYQASSLYGSDIDVQVAFNNNALYRDATKIKSKELFVVGTTIHKEDSWEFPFKLLPPEILSHTVRPTGTGNFSNGTIVKYKIAVLDNKSNQVISMDPDNPTNKFLNYNVTIDKPNSSVMLKVFLDPELYGFRIYRALDTGVLVQVYDSTVIGELIVDVTETDGTVTLLDASKFPNSGTIRIDNEFMIYKNKVGNELRNISGFRGQFDTSPAKHQALIGINKYNRVYLMDYAGYHNNIYDGQKPHYTLNHGLILNDRQKKFNDYITEIIDDNIKFSPCPVLFSESWNTQNDTKIIPKNIGLKLNINNDSDNKTETMTVHDLICNIEYVK